MCRVRAFSSIIPWFVAVVADGVLALTRPGADMITFHNPLKALHTFFAVRPGLDGFGLLFSILPPILTVRLYRVPQVLDSEGSSYASDVYSFGIVVWEVISRKLPWSNKTRPTEIMFAVLKGIRPSFRVDAPADIVDIAKACWCGEPKERTTFRAILEGMKAKGWVVNDE